MSWNTSIAQPLCVCNAGIGKLGVYEGKIVWVGKPKIERAAGQSGLVVDAVPNDAVGLARRQRRAHCEQDPRVPCTQQLAQHSHALLGHGQIPPAGRTFKSMTWVRMLRSLNAIGKFVANDKGAYARGFFTGQTVRMQDYGHDAVGLRPTRRTVRDQTIRAAHLASAERGLDTGRMKIVHALALEQLDARAVDRLHAYTAGIFCARNKVVGCSQRHRCSDDILG